MTRHALLLPLACLAACSSGGDMVQQPRLDPYEQAELFPEGSVMRHPPAGTAARDLPVRTAAAERPPLTPALLERGRERYGIYCAMCHGDEGLGDGTVVRRGFPAPPSFREARLRAAPSAYFYQVISNGYGVMYGYGDRVAPADRWAIAAYLRALQATAPERTDAR